MRRLPPCAPDEIHDGRSPSWGMVTGYQCHQDAWEPSRSGLVLTAWDRINPSQLQLAQKLRRVISMEWTVICIIPGSRKAR